MSKERDKAILELLLIHKKVTVKQLAEHLYISEPSIRRDLARLESQNLIKRVHGGAILEENPFTKSKIPFTIREFEQSDAKLIMAQKALELISDNQVIFLDASTSAYNIIQYLSLRSNVTVITNGVKALQKLAELGIRTISTGGELNPSTMALTGEEAYKTIDTINADLAFFSCRGVSDEGYLTDISSAENYVRQHMIKQATHSYLLCANEKFGKKHFHTLCHRDDIDGVISDVDCI